MTCRPRGWKAPGANWPRSGIPGTASAAGRRSNTDCSPIPRAARSALTCSRATTAEAIAFKTAAGKVRKDFGLKELVFAGDRGMITKTRIADLRKLEGAGWVTALKAPDIAVLAADGGPLQLSLFDEQKLAEITHPDYPGERLVCCRNPALAESRRLKRESLLAATEADLEKIRASVAAGRLKDKDKIGVRVGKVIGKHKVGKHFTWDITGDGFSFRRDQDKIATEARLDGIY